MTWEELKEKAKELGFTISYYIDEAKLFVEIVGKTIKDFDEHKIDNAIGEK